MNLTERKIMVIANPKAANGQVAKAWPDIARILQTHLPPHSVEFTTGPFIAPKLTREAIQAGYDLILAIGGDGTNNEIVNGFIDNDVPLNPNAVFAPITIGTGGDFIKTVCPVRGVEELLKVLKTGTPRLIDLGKLTFLDNCRQQTQRYFLNITSAGIGGEVDARVNRTTKRFGGFASFLWGAVASIVTFKGKRVEITIDDDRETTYQIFNVVVANGKFFGGGMMVAPNAEIDDGWFDVIIMKDAPMWRILTTMPKVYKGGHLSNPMIELKRAKKVVVTSDDVVLIDMDGEQPGRLPATFELVPKILPLAW